MAGDATAPYAVPPEVVSVTLDGETVAWHETTGSLHRLDAVGSSVLAACDGRRPDGAVVAAVAAAYGAAEDVVRADVLRFLDHLASLDLLRRTSG